MTADSKRFHPHGKHLIAGEWVGGGETFANSPATGESDQFQSGTPAHVDRACQAAEEAFWSYAYASRETRAAFLDTIADEMEARAETITEIGTRESAFRASGGGQPGSFASLPITSAKARIWTGALTAPCPNANQCRAPTSA